MGSGEIGVIPTLNATTFVAMTQDGKLAEGFEAIYTEMEKVRRYGFTQGEFERAQNDLMRRAERAYANRNDRRNGEFVQTYLNNYSKNTPMPDAETEWQLDSMLIKMINVEAVNGFAQQVIYPRNQVIVVTAPEKEGIVNPTAEELLAIREKVANAEIEAYEDNTVKEPLIPEGTVLKGSPVKKTAQDATLGTTEWTLANGVKVVVKPTIYKADEVRMSAVAKGGLSILSDEEFYMGEEGYKDKFESVKIAEPLLGEVGADATVINADKAAVAEAITAEAVKDAGFDSLDAVKEDGTAFVFMGHGTSHTAKVSYSQMQTQMEQLGYDNVFIGTVEGEPEDTSCEAVIEKLKEAGYKKVILRPLMVVAGDHANNDMAGDDDDSWKSQFEASGAFDSIDTQIAGLGEIQAIQQLYVAHTQAAIDAE